MTYFNLSGRSNFSFSGCSVVAGRFDLFGLTLLLNGIANNQAIVAMSNAILIQSGTLFSTIFLFGFAFDFNLVRFYGCKILEIAVRTYNRRSSIKQILV